MEFKVILLQEINIIKRINMIIIKEKMIKNNKIMNKNGKVNRIYRNNIKNNIKKQKVNKLFIILFHNRKNNQIKIIHTDNEIQVLQLNMVQKYILITRNNYKKLLIINKKQINHLF